MSVINSLVLDHFYTNFSADDSDSLLPLTKLLRAAAHQKVQTTDDAWEGMYLYSRTGAYFELSRQRRQPGFLGLCFSPIVPVNVDASKITTETNYDWLKRSRVLKDGQTWFDAYFVGPAIPENEKLFDPWIMRYHQRHVEYKKRPVARSIDRFQTLHLTLGREQVGIFGERGPWMPLAPIIEDDRVVLDVPDRDGFIFQIVVDLVEGRDRFNFRSLTFTHSDPEAFAHFQSQNLGRYQLSCEDRLVKLEVRE